jgi:predicted secreted protein
VRHGHGHDRLFAGLRLRKLSNTILTFGCKPNGGLVTVSSIGPLSRAKRRVQTGVTSQTTYVRVGDEVVIQLPAQMGTGYSWQLRARDAKVAVPQGETELKSTPGQAPGAAEQQLFGFKIQAPGSTTVHLQYVRPWEKNQHPQKTFQVTLHAQ